MAVEVFEARRLIRAAASATLATSVAGQPHASLVTPATAPDLAVLLWLSTLSEHTRHLAAEPRCALLFQGAAAEANPQTTPRVGITGRAERVPEGEAAALKARWLARHPYAALYAGFSDFALWRIRPETGLLVAGFGQARRLGARSLLPDPAAVAAIAAAEPALIAEANGAMGTALGAIAARLLHRSERGPWRLVALDVDGADLAAGEAPPARLHFRAPVADEAALRAELAHAAAEAGAAGDGGSRSN